MKKIITTQDCVGQRIDRFLKEGFFCNEEISRSEIARFIKDKKVLVNNRSTKPSYTLREGDEIFMEHKTWGIEQKNIIPNNEVKFEVIFENKDFIIINKPAGLKIHPNNFNEKDTLVNGLLKKFPEIEKVGEDPLRPGIVHRIDKDTSGLMIVVRNQKAFDIFKEKFQKKGIQKTYLALVHGHLENPKGIIEKPIARATTYKKQVIAGRKTKTKIREAVTEFEVLKSFKDIDLVKALPKTGRMHQIRVHFFSLGHPLVGDEKYKLKKFENPDNLTGQILHAQKIEFEYQGKKFSFSTSLQDFLEMVECKQFLFEG